VQTVVFTRKQGKPWMYVPTFESSLSTIIPSVLTAWGLPAVGNAEWIDAYVGLLDETVVVVQPWKAAGAVASGDTTDSSVTFQAGGVLPLTGDYGNAFSVVLDDPGVPNSLLTLSSTTGYDFVISLATDNMGAITTTSDEIEEIVIGSGVAGNVSQTWVLFCVNNGSTGPLVAEVIPMVGGDSGGANSTYEVTGSY
jgi:hypothetical protein